MIRIRHRVAFGLVMFMLVAPASVAAKGPTKVQPGQSVVVWSNPNATGTSEVAKVVVTATGITALTGGTINGGCEYRTFNALGWTLTRYTLYQTFTWNGTNITYYPTPSKSTEGNWSWYDNGSQDPVKHWITNPRSAYTIGNYAFRRDVGDFHESHNGTVRMDLRGTGSWWCSVT